VPILRIGFLSPTLPFASFVAVILIVKNSMSALLQEGLVVPQVWKSSGRGRYGAMGELFLYFLPGAWILSEVGYFILLSALGPYIIAVINFVKYASQAESQLSSYFG
jgi:hypothetical protein